MTQKGKKPSTFIRSHICMLMLIVDGIYRFQVQPTISWPQQWKLLSKLPRCQTLLLLYSTSMYLFSKWNLIFVFKIIRSGFYGAKQVENKGEVQLILLSNCFDLVMNVGKSIWLECFIQLILNFSTIFQTF